MERLTERTGELTWIKGRFHESCCDMCEEVSGECYRCDLNFCMEKLADYEDAEEQGKWKLTGINKMDKRNKQIADHYGPLHQLIKLSEEMGELQQAVAKSIMYAMDTEKITQSEDHSEVLTELADVKIMLDQTQYIYGITDEEITKEINYKLNRQIERIENE